MTRDTLTDRELDKVYRLYEQYGADNLGDFLRMVWKEAYDLGHGDGAKVGFIEGFNKGRTNGA